MVVSEQMEQPVQDENFDLFLHRMAMLFRLAGGALRGDQNIAQPAVFSIGEGEHIRGATLAAKPAVGPPNRGVGRHYDREFTAAGNLPANPR
jgi:hypothetical protein